MKLALHGGSPVITGELEPYISIGSEEVSAVNRVMQSGNLSSFIGAHCGQFYGGPEILSFEREWAEKFKCRYAISVNSNTSGLIASMGAIGISPGDEVIVPPFTMSATVMAPLFYGGIPVFADIDPVTYCIDPEKVIEQINNKTKAIIAVNMFGHPAELHKLRNIADDHGIFLIEDAAQSPLAYEGDLYAGTVGHIGVFSLNYHKHIHTGEGGICCTNDPELALRLAAIRNHGENIVDPMEVVDCTNLIGFNFRLTEIQAAIGREQLKKIDRLVDERQKIAERLTRDLSNLPGLNPPTVRQDCRHVYYVWMARYDAVKTGIPRAKIVDALLAEGVPVTAGYVTPLYLLPAFQRRVAIGSGGWPFVLSDKKYEKGLCPVAEKMHDEQLIEFCSCSYQLSENDLSKVILGFQKVFSLLDSLRD